MQSTPSLTDDRRDSKAEGVVGRGTGGGVGAGVGTLPPLQPVMAVAWL